MAQKALTFYNVKLRRKVTTNNYKIVKKETKSGTRLFAVAQFRGTEMWRIVGAE